MGDLFTRVAGWGDTCILELQPAAEALPIILGDTFLRTVSAIFDAKGLRVGLAQRDGHGPRLKSTKEHLERDGASTRSGPLLSPHRPSAYLSLTCTAIAFALGIGAGAGFVLGHLFGCLLDLCCPPPSARVAARSLPCARQSDSYVR